MKPLSYRQQVADEDDRKCYRRAWWLCMTPADAQAFSDALKAAFPAIRFVARDYWEPFVDQARWLADCREWTRREKLGLPRINVRRHMRDPAGEPPRFLESLAVPEVNNFFVWVEPPGWRPVWGPEDDQGLRYLENTPRLWFQFCRADFIRGWPGGRGEKADPRPKHSRDIHVLRGDRFVVRWNPREPEAEAFGKKVWNILRQLTVCEFFIFDSLSRRAYRAQPQRSERMLLAGRDAAAWSLKRRHNYLRGNTWDALLKPSAYRLRPGDAMTKPEYRRWRAEDERMTREDARLRKEADERFSALGGGSFAEFESRGRRLVSARLYVSAGLSPAGKPQSRVALELYVRRRNGRAEWSARRKRPPA